MSFMNRKSLAITALSVAALSFGALQWSAAEESEAIPNKLIDYEGFKNSVIKMESTREQKRLTEQEFAEALTDPNVVVLDARSEHRFAQHHIEGAINLPFTEFTEINLAEVIPNKDTPVLIYCNNNFEGNQIAFATKRMPASLNVHTQSDLNVYGYTNVFELGPVVDVDETILPMAGEHEKNPPASDN